MTSPAGQDQRLRPHPQARFARPQVAVDLNEVVAQLRSEPQAGEGGHRQKAIYKEGGVTMALFVFDRFTGLAPHRARGIVSMHVLRGRVKITAGDEVHELPAGQLLVLAPDIEHAVAAEVESELLVTIHLAA